MITDTHGWEPGEPGAHRGGPRPQAPALLHRRDGILPTTAAALSVPGRGALTATASRAGAPPALHPVVREVFDNLGTAQRERHLGRCPEAALLSRFLSEAEADTLDAARLALAEAGITIRHIREDGDPMHGSFAPHCGSCAVLIARLGVLSTGSPAGHPAESGPATGAPWTTGTVEEIFTAAGWEPGRRHVAQAEEWADALSAHRSPQGHGHSLFPAAFETWAELGNLILRPAGPGVDHAPSTVVIDPLLGLHWARTLDDLGQALGTRLCPLGQELGGTALIALDREGRLYCVDHTGDWYLGPDVISGLSTLLTGRAPMRLELPED